MPAQKITDTVTKAVNHYRRGSDFERRIEADLAKHGFHTARTAGSKGAHKADVLAWRAPGEWVLVQAKRTGVIGSEEWNQLFQSAQDGLAVPVLASVGKNGRGIVYDRLTGLRKPRGRLHPKEPYDPARRKES